MRLLSSSTKVLKSLNHGVLTAIMYLQPARESGVNLCPSHTAACASGCLRLSGRMAMPNASTARARRTSLLLSRKQLFLTQLREEIRRHAASAAARGLLPAVRLNGTSDLNATSLIDMPAFPTVQFYDYTKVFARLAQPLPPNYHLTFSWSGTNLEQCLRALDLDFCVAVPYDVKPGHPLPLTDPRFANAPVIDGDITDFRPSDPPSSIVGLRWKSVAHYPRSSALASGFLLPPP